MREFEFKQEITIAVSGKIRVYDDQIDIKYDVGGMREALDNKLIRLVKRVLKGTGVDLSNLDKHVGRWDCIELVNTLGYEPAKKRGAK